MKWRGTFLDKYAAVTARSVETIADKKLLFICFVQFISAFQRVMPAVDRFDEGASFLFFVSRTYPGDKKGKASRSVKFTTQTHTHTYTFTHTSNQGVTGSSAPVLFGREKCVVIGQAERIRL